MSTTADIKPITCPHCGFYHKTTCGRIKAIEYYQDGTVKRVELHSPLPMEIYSGSLEFKGFSDGH